MIASPASNLDASSFTVLSVISPAGTITHAARGLSSLETKSSSDSAPVAPSPARSSIAFGLTSKTTHSCPARISRRTMLAPIRPSPTIPSCMGRILERG